MTVDHVHRFLVEVEGEDKATKEDAESIMESLNELKHLNIFHRKGLHLEAFFHYLFSDSNPPLSPSPKIQEVIRGTKDALSLAQVSLLTENGNTKDDLRLPTDDALLTQYGGSFWFWSHVFIGEWLGWPEPGSQCSHIWPLLCTCSGWTFQGCLHVLPWQWQSSRDEA